MIRFNNGLYSANIEDGNLILDSLTETWIIEGLGKEITEDAREEFFKLEWAGQRINPFTSEFIDRHLQSYVDYHKSEAQKVHDLSKELN